MITISKFHFLPSNKHSLVLLHAFPLSSTMWEDAAHHIAQKAPFVNIILVNLPGFGDAPVLAQWTMAEAAVELQKTLKQEGILEPIIGGLSMGGYLALAYYRLFHYDVKGLILSNTKASADDEKGRKDREDFAVDAEKRGHETVLERLEPKLASNAAVKKHHDLRDKIKDIIKSNSPKSIAPAQRAMKVRDDSTDLLSTISCPTLLITGEDDGIIPFEMMEEMSSQIHNAKFISFMKGGHLTAMEEPEKWATVVSSFLNVL